MIPQADRLRARVGIAWMINPVLNLNRWAADRQLTAYIEPERGEPMPGWPVCGGCAVMTATRQVWWRPDTVAEMLDHFAPE